MSDTDFNVEGEWAMLGIVVFSTIAIAYPPVIGIAVVTLLSTYVCMAVAGAI